MTVYLIKNNVFYFCFWIVLRSFVFITVSLLIVNRLDLDFNNTIFFSLVVFFIIIFLYYSSSGFDVNKIIYKVDILDDKIIVSYNYLFILFRKDVFFFKSTKLTQFNNSSKFVLINKGYFLMVNGKIKGSIPLSNFLDFFKIDNKLENYITVNK